MPAQTPPPKAIRIILVDDHPVVRDGLAEVINREPDLAVCAVAEDHRGALEAVQNTHPHLVVVDLMLKSSSGLELIKDLRARWPKLFILVVSMHDENLYAERVLRVGQSGPRSETPKAEGRRKAEIRDPEKGQTVLSFTKQAAF